jgi:hypothetical protein
MWALTSRDGSRNLRLADGVGVCGSRVDGMNSILVTDGGSLFPRICWEVSGVEGGV